MRVVFGLLTSCLVVPASGIAQEIPAADRAKLKQAERTADKFVERFRQTLDFSVPWKEFRALRFNECALVALDGETNLSEEEKAKLGGRVLEKTYVALMNYYYLKGAHDLSIARMDSDNTEEEVITPKRILRVENASPYTRTNPEPPSTARQLKDATRAYERLSKLYRRHLPRNVMRTAAWEANYKYLLGRSGVTHLGVEFGRKDFCVPEGVKYYVVNRGLFYFYIVEEKGRMKVIGMGFGD